MNRRVIIDAISYESRQRSPAPFSLFTLYVLVHLVSFFLMISYLFPNLWANQLEIPLPTIAITFIVLHFIFSIGEYLFHRYILHIMTYEIMGVFYRKHNIHHGLTPIRHNEPEHKIYSKYPIASIDQDECGTFPWWALLSFLSGFSVPLVTLGFIFSHVPFLIAGYPALTFSYYLYEVVHVNHHKSSDLWLVKIKNPIFGKMWRKICGFHQAHHANYKCNMHVGGFFGLPVGDWLFGTYKQPAQLMFDGTPADQEVVELLNPKPRWPITWLDAYAQRRKSRILTQ